MNYMGSRSASPTRHDPYIATSGDVTTATTSATTTTATTTSTKKTVLVAFYFFICSIRLRWAFARNSEADISKRELSFRNGHRITVLAPCTLPVCMHLCSHIACFMYACTVFAPCTVPVCMHQRSHVAFFMYACIGVRTMHDSSYALDERTHRPTTVTEKEMTTHTQKY